MRRKSEWVRPTSIQIAVDASRIKVLDRHCAASGMTRPLWVRACVYRLLDREPTFPKEGALALVQIRHELRRIGVAARMLAARAEAAGAAERTVNDAWKLHAEIRQQLYAVRAAVAGNLAYWDGGDE